jgi:predicted DNA-binding ribbon-helix-helix protein
MLYLALLIPNILLACALMVANSAAAYAIALTALISTIYISFLLLRQFQALSSFCRVSCTCGDASTLDLCSRPST